ncbi:MAG TPA: tRNA (adenine-N1)-methyltransferase [Euzebyales bacterium]|nr:tRNA (adenine-N1)-methyltransferase [Euzebyales bacterium]
MTPPRFPGDAAMLEPDETVLLVERKQRRYLVTLAVGGEFHFHGGAVAHDDILGQPEGVRVRSAKGTYVRAYRPTSADWTVKAPRGAQVIYPKDQALIVGLADIGPGMTVVEAGAGSGALTCALLRAVGERGRVISFEVRDEHADVAERTVARRFGGLPPNWKLRRGDALAGLADLSCHRVVLDLLEPWELCKSSASALFPGGILCTYTPSVPQVMRVHEALAEDGRWGGTETVEALIRPWHVAGLAVRPAHRMVAHTAFLTFARRLPDVPPDSDDDATPGV